MFCYKVVKCEEVRAGGYRNVPPKICFPELLVPPESITDLVHLVHGDKVARLDVKSVGKAS